MTHTSIALLAPPASSPSPASPHSPAKPSRPSLGRRVGPTILVALGVVACCAVLHLTPTKLWMLACGAGLPKIDQLLMGRFRVPRLTMAAMVGSGMAVAGWAAQRATRNPLASPDVLGVSAAAAFGVSLTLLLSGGQLIGPYVLPFAAAGSGVLAAALLFAVVGRRRSLDGSAFLLVGIALSALLSAATFFIDMFAPPGPSGQGRGAAFMAGQLQRASWDYVWLLLPAWWLLTLGVALFARPLSALAFDDAVVTALGGRPRVWRVVGLCLAGALCAACVGVAGGFGFVGFVAPHVARAAGGRRAAEHPWPSAGVGAGLLVAADAVGQYVAWPDQVPAGVVVAILGGPLFLTFMLRRRLVTTG